MWISERDTKMKRKPIFAFAYVCPKCNEEGHWSTQGEPFTFPRKDSCVCGARYIIKGYETKERYERIVENHAVIRLMPELRKEE